MSEDRPGGRLPATPAVLRAVQLLAICRAKAALGCTCGRADWRVTRTRGRVRYLKCACGRTGKIALLAAERYLDV